MPCEKATTRWLNNFVSGVFLGMGGDKTDTDKIVGARIKRDKKIRNIESRIKETFDGEKVAVKSCCHFVICSTIPMGQTDACSDINGQPDMLPCSSVCIPNVMLNIAAKKKIPANIATNVLNFTPLERRRLLSAVQTEIVDGGVMLLSTGHEAPVLTGFTDVLNKNSILKVYTKVPVSSIRGSLVYIKLRLPFAMNF